MRNIKLIDAVIQLHEIARLIREQVGGEVGADFLAEQIGICADELHKYSILDDKANTVANSVIEQSKTIDTDSLDVYNEERLVSKYDKENIKGKK